MPAVAAASASTSATASSSAAAPAPASSFSLFTLADFRAFSADDELPRSPAAHEVEDRADLYLIDSSLPQADSYGLKLRGVQSSEHQSGESVYALELKVRKEAQHAAATSIASSSLLPASFAEDWRKVIRGDRIRCTFAGLVSAILPSVRHALSTAKLQERKKMSESLAVLQAALEERERQGGSAFRIVAVRKQRSSLDAYGAEQTDVEVTLITPSEAIAAGAGDSAAAASATAAVSSSPARTYRYRSICVESSDRDHAEAPQVRALFTHLLQRYGDARAVKATSASSDGAFVGGYPAFLRHVLSLP
jgi:hypothetical protein